MKKLIDTSNIIVYDMAKLWNLIVGTLYGDLSLEYEYFWIKRGNCYKFFLGFYKVFKKRIKYGARQCTRIFFWYNNHTTLKSNWYFTILICPPNIFVLSPADAQMNEVNFEPWTFLKMIKQVTCMYLHFKYGEFLTTSYNLIKKRNNLASQWLYFWYPHAGPLEFVLNFFMDQTRMRGKETFIKYSEERVCAWQHMVRWSSFFICPHTDNMFFPW